MSFFISPQNQLEINEAVVRLGEQLEKVPESFFYNLSNKQFDLCMRVQKYIQPVVAPRAEFDADGDPDQLSISKQRIEDNLRKDFITRGLKIDDVSKMHKITDSASTFTKSSGWFGKNDRVADVLGASKILSQHFDKTFHDSLEEFKKLTKILRSKIPAHQELAQPPAGETLFAALPQEIIQLILSMTDLDSIVAFTGVQKNIDKLTGADTSLCTYSKNVIWKNLANQLSVNKLSPQIIDDLRITILYCYRLPIQAVFNLYTAKPQYAQDPRFERVFGRQRFLSEIAKEKVSADNLLILIEWKRTRHILSTWSRLAKATRIVITDEYLGSHTDPSLWDSDKGLGLFSPLWRNMDLMTRALKGMGPWLKANRAAIAGLTKLNLSNIGLGLEELPEFIAEMTALETLSLELNELTTLPEWFTNLTSLRKLTTDASFPELPEAMSHVEHIRF